MAWHSQDIQATVVKLMLLSGKEMLFPDHLPIGKYQVQTYDETSFSMEHQQASHEEALLTLKSYKQNAYNNRQIQERVSASQQSWRAYPDLSGHHQLRQYDLRI